MVDALFRRLGYRLAPGPIALDDALIGPQAVAHGSPEVALRAAMRSLRAAFAAGAITPRDVHQVVAELDLGAFDLELALRFDLMLRELVMGNLPVLTLRPGPPGSVTLSARITRSVVPSDNSPVYRGLDRGALNAAYNLRAGIADVGVVFDRWWEEGTRFRDEHASAIDVAYAAGPRATFDLYLPSAVRRPPLILIHGGYFQTMDVRNHGQFAAGALAHGAPVVLVNYDLCPTVAFAGIFAGLKYALAKLPEVLAEQGVSMRDAVLVGHSAGAVLASWAVTNTEVPFGLVAPFSRVILLSGVYDLEPFRFLGATAALGVGEAEVQRFSSIRQRLHLDCQVTVATAAHEPAEMHRQADEAAYHWGAHRISVDANHFSIVEELADPASMLCRLACEAPPGALAAGTSQP